MLSDSPLVVEILSCEKANLAHSNYNNSKQPKAQMTFRKPIDYKNLGIETDEIVHDEEDEEKIFVDLSENHNKVVSITDLLLGDDNNGGTKER